MNRSSENEDAKVSEATGAIGKIINMNDFYEGVGILPSEYDQVVHLSAQIEDTFIHQLIYSEVL
jgi:hypothetical protein